MLTVCEREQGACECKSRISVVFVRAAKLCLNFKLSLRRISSGIFPDQYHNLYI